MTEVVNGKTIDEINQMFADASREAAEKFAAEQEEAERIAEETHLAEMASEIADQQLWEDYVEENGLTYADVSGGW